MSIQQKYNTKAAALYRDKISTLAQGKTWSESASPAQNYSSLSNPSMTLSTQHSSGISRSSSNYQQSQKTSSSALGHSKSYQDCSGNGSGGGSGSSGYQDAGGYQNFNSNEFRDQKECFFNRLQEENATRPA